MLRTYRFFKNQIIQDGKESVTTDGIVRHISIDGEGVAIGYIRAPYSLPERSGDCWWEVRKVYAIPLGPPIELIANSDPWQLYAEFYRDNPPFLSRG